MVLVQFGFRIRTEPLGPGSTGLGLWIPDQILEYCFKTPPAQLPFVPGVTAPRGPNDNPINNSSQAPAGDAPKTETPPPMESVAEEEDDMEM